MTERRQLPGEAPPGLIRGIAMEICAVSTDLNRYYSQQESLQHDSEERDSYVKYLASELAERQPYEMLIECAGLEGVEAINRLVKAKSSLELFDAQRALLDVINEQAMIVAERLQP